MLPYLLAEVVKLPRLLTSWRGNQHQTLEILLRVAEIASPERHRHLS